MCGLAGIATAPDRRPDIDALDRMVAALGHRGPDGTGRHIGRNVAIGHTRLAIIDLETGDQPLYDAGGNALLANGEIYNYVELREDLDATFSTRSDCEPPLVLYARDGPGFAGDLRGMYAIVIHDPAAERLTLARDPFGIKPLYYAEHDGMFAFASEPEALIAGGFASRELRPETETELLQLQFTTGAETIWRDVRRILPGETLVVSRGRIVERRHRAALPCGGPVPVEEEAALDALDRVLEDTVSVHCRSDVGYGMFLSGGIDSTALLSMMARLDDRPVRAFTAGFDAPGAVDERDHARTIARRLGAEHIEVPFGERDFWQVLPGVAAAMDDPAADYACLPTWKLATVAAQDLKVVLTGEGGDELFGGYGRYRSAMRPWWQGGRRMRPRGLLDDLGVLREETPGWRDGIAAAETRERRPERTRLQVAQAVDCADWLPNDILTKLDRCLMAHGLEGRTPFLDPKVAGFAFLLPDRLKVRNNLGKWLLRRWLARALPESEPFAAKRGFTVPVADWIRARGAEIGPLVAAQPGVERLCDPDAVHKLFTGSRRRGGLACWILLFYAVWHQVHVVGIEPGEDAVAVLAGR